MCNEAGHAVVNEVGSGRAAEPETETFHNLDLHLQVMRVSLGAAGSV